MRAFAQGEKPARQAKSASAEAEQRAFAAQSPEISSILRMQRSTCNPRR